MYKRATPLKASKDPMLVTKKILTHNIKLLSMPITAPFNLKKWIDENRDLLKPPVGNQCIYKNAENFIVMVVGGPNARKDYHFNESEELYYQVEGNIMLKIIDDGVPKNIPINEGDMFLLP